MSQSVAAERVVLIVDDEEPNRQLLSALLGAQGYAVRIARDGPSALEEVRGGGIDLMLLDVMMPGMDGIEACQRVRHELGAVDLLIVFVTALSDRESRLRAKLAGADDFLVKPIDSFELTFRVANWMKLRRLREYELYTAELEGRLSDAAEQAEAVARTLGTLAEHLSCEPVAAHELASVLSRSAAGLSAGAEQARRPLLSRIPGGSARYAYGLEGSASGKQRP